MVVWKSPLHRRPPSWVKPAKWNVMVYNRWVRSQDGRWWGWSCKPDRGGIGRPEAGTGHEKPYSPPIPSSHLNLALDSTAKLQEWPGACKIRSLRAAWEGWRAFTYLKVFYGSVPIHKNHFLPSGEKNRTLGVSAFFLFFIRKVQLFCCKTLTID